MKHVAEFINELSTNESMKNELGECVAKADTSDGKIKLAVQYARDAGFDVSEEEFAAMVEKTNVKSELSDDELETVAGGTVDTGYTDWALVNYANDNLTTGTSNATQIGNDVLVGMAAIVDAGFTGGSEAIKGLTAATDFIGDIFSSW
jgi:predicted ribosomally synthesized peptide with nif11-like leader